MLGQLSQSVPIPPPLFFAYVPIIMYPFLAIDTHSPINQFQLQPNRINIGWALLPDWIFTRHFICTRHERASTVD